ncbi:MAG: AraC family transcriptional regulator, partial [Eubacterium sp.]|nr:AraC family transcriptional regulator [Eubacterium sp.]
FKIFSGTIDEIVMMHAHTKNGYELHLIDYGKGILSTEDNQYELSKNSLYITGPNVLHKQTPDKKDPMHELCIYFKITNHKNESCAVDAFASKKFWIGKSNAEVRKLFKQMVLENEKKSVHKKDIISSLAIRLIVEIARLYYPENEADISQTKNTDLNESRSWILDQLLLEDCSNVKLEDFAKNMGVSSRQAERIIKDYYGSSFKKLRYEAKMAMAATLLEEKNISVEECAIKCGYTCSAAFITAFKQKYRLTPRAYRENLKAKSIMHSN